jgi:hypothetical protein
MNNITGFERSCEEEEEEEEEEEFGRENHVHGEWVVSSELAGCNGEVTEFALNSYVCIPAVEFFTADMRLSN